MKSKRLATIAHELGHLMCGHLGTPPGAPWYRRELLSTTVKEFEAESVAWLVCERLGIKNPSAEYLSGFLNRDEPMPKVSLESVLKAAGWIEAMTKKRLPARKPFVVGGAESLAS